MKEDLTRGIQNPHKIQDIIVQTITNVTTYRNNETNRRYRNDTYLENYKKTPIINTKSSEEGPKFQRS